MIANDISNDSELSTPNWGLRIECRSTMFLSLNMKTVTMRESCFHILQLNSQAPPHASTSSPNLSIFKPLSIVPLIWGSDIYFLVLQRMMEWLSVMYPLLPCMWFHYHTNYYFKFHVRSFKDLGLLEHWLFPSFIHCFLQSSSWTRLIKEQLVNFFIRITISSPKNQIARLYFFFWDS